MAGLVIKEKIGLKLAQKFTLGQPAQKHGFVDLDIPVHQRSDGAFMRRRAARSDQHPHEVRIAFDGDAVLFSDEAERVFQSQGLNAFQQHERDNAAQPLLAGPFKPLLEALHRLQEAGTSRMRIRTALVTARSAPAHERAIRTLMDWNIQVDEAMFLGGLAKGEFLREFEPDFFFDDQTGHVNSAALHVPSGHVASGVSNPKA
jgi:5'-nucleotidase